MQGWRSQYLTCFVGSLYWMCNHRVLISWSSLWISSNLSSSSTIVVLVSSCWHIEANSVGTGGSGRLIGSLLRLLSSRIGMLSWWIGMLSWRQEDVSCSGWSRGELSTDETGATFRTGYLVPLPSSSIQAFLANSRSVMKGVRCPPFTSRGSWLPGLGAEPGLRAEAGRRETAPSGRLSRWKGRLIIGKWALASNNYTMHCDLFNKGII